MTNSLAPNILLSADPGHLLLYLTGVGKTYEKLYQTFNPLRAKFSRGNINIYLHFISLLHIDMTQALKILPQVRPGLTYST